jgi:phosphatidylethanolamine/phosphatidyl-N-methylethanolamine N-methyltransferase
VKFKKSKVVDSNYGSVSDFYENFYGQLQCGDGRGLTSKITHKSLETKINARHYSKVIEVGAGNGEHLKFLKHSFDCYLLTDLKYKNMNIEKEPSNKNIFFKHEDAMDFTFDDNIFDRLVATCIILHLRDPEKAMNEWRRVVKANGLISIYVPNGENVFTQLARNMTTGRRAKRLGYQGLNLFIAREHLNSAWAIEQLIRYVFCEDEVKIVTWPRLPFFMRIFTTYQIRVLK